MACACFRPALPSGAEHLPLNPTPSPTRSTLPLTYTPAGSTCTLFSQHSRIYALTCSDPIRCFHNRLAEELDFDPSFSGASHMDDIQIGDLEDQDQWSDAHDTLDDQSLIGHPTGIEQVHTQQDMAVHNVKISTDDDKTDPSPILDSGRGESMSTAGGIAPDTASIHSLPAVHITESDPPTRRPSTANAPESNIPTAARARQPSPLPSEAEASLTPHERRHRHRSAAEVQCRLCHNQHLTYNAVSLRRAHRTVSPAFSPALYIVGKLG